MSRPAIFLDRDGVIVENRDRYVRSWADVELLPRSVEVLALASCSPYLIVLITNQSAVGRGIITLEAATAINDRLVALIREGGGRIDAVYMCPHGPDDRCGCRKPLPGLLLQAADELDIDLSRSMMIGDALTDIEAGQAAGVGQLILLRSGRGRDQEGLLRSKEVPHLYIYDTLFDALSHLIDSRS